MGRRYYSFYKHLTDSAERSRTAHSVAVDSQSGRLLSLAAEIEVTETALVNDIDTAKLVLTALRSIGILISLDDFGTGYSSLYHLRERRFDKIKIDRSFVQSMKENGDSEKIVEAILSLAKSLGLPTVAEGIENPDVLQRLAAMGCEFGQGYYFGKAMTAKQATAMLDVDAKRHQAV
jgi:EAL domain-containing protein (putative c-di-GMP-specific phosphodiesterase class I)